MAKSGEPEHAELRGSALLQLLPALVHRLNNALLVIQGVQELGTLASASELTRARAEVVELARALALLATFARGSLAAVETLGGLFPAVEGLVRPLATSRQCTFESCREGDAELRAGFDLQGLLTLACVGELDFCAGGVFRLSARPSARGALLAWMRSGGGALAAGSRALLEAGRVRGWRHGSHATRAAVGAFMIVPLGARALPVEAPVPVEARRRVLVVCRAPFERELVSAVLEEHCCSVLAHASEPPEVPAAGFDFVLVGAELVREDPTLLARLRRRFERARLELLQPRLPPAAVLALVRD